MGKKAKLTSNQHIKGLLLIIVNDNTNGLWISGNLYFSLKRTFASTHERNKRAGQVGVFVFGTSKRVLIGDVRLRINVRAKREHQLAVDGIVRRVDSVHGRLCIEEIFHQTRILFVNGCDVQVGPFGFYNHRAVRKANRHVNQQQAKTSHHGSQPNNKQQQQQ